MDLSRPIKAIHAATPAETALRRLVRASAQAFVRNLAHLMASADPEGPHKARVSLRRLRATLTAFRPILRKSVARKRLAQVRDLGRLISPLRDADVLALDMGLPEFVAAADAQRRLTRKALRHAKAAKWAADLARDMAGKAWHRRGKHARTARKAPVPPLAVKALDRCWRRCLAHGADLGALSETLRHDLRKCLKTQRYLCDQFAPIWPSVVERPFLSVLADLQDCLGRLNDLALARARGLDRPDDPALLAQAQTLWAALQTTPLFWGKPRPAA